MTTNYKGAAMRTRIKGWALNCVAAFACATTVVGVVLLVGLGSLAAGTLAHFAMHALVGTPCHH